MTDDDTTSGDSGDGAVDTPADADDSPPDAVEDARERVIEAMARAAEVYGVQQSYGRLYGVLYFAEEPQSLDDLAEHSDYAKSTVSTAMQGLERLHLVRRRSLPGEGKRAFFEAERDLWQVFQRFLENEVMREIRIMGRALDDAEATLEDVDDDRARRDLERVRELKTLYDRSERLLSLLTSQSVGTLKEFADRVETFLS